MRQVSFYRFKPNPLEKFFQALESGVWIERYSTHGRVYGYGLYLVIFNGVSFKFLGRDKELTSDEFLKFQEDIQFDILKMEFDKLGPDENNMISQKAFGK